MNIARYVGTPQVFALRIVCKTARNTINDFIKVFNELPSLLTISATHTNTKTKTHPGGVSLELWITLKMKEELTLGEPIVFAAPITYTSKVLLTTMRLTINPNFVISKVDFDDQCVQINDPKTNSETATLRFVEGILNRHTPQTANFRILMVSGEFVTAEPQITRIFGSVEVGPATPYITVRVPRFYLNPTYSHPMALPNFQNLLPKRSGVLTTAECFEIFKRIALEKLQERQPEATTRKCPFNVNEALESPPNGTPSEAVEALVNTLKHIEVPIFVASLAEFQCAVEEGLHRRVKGDWYCFKPAQSVSSVPLSVHENRPHLRFAVGVEVFFVLDLSDNGLANKNTTIFLLSA